MKKPIDRKRAPSVRQLRVGEEIRHGLAEVFSRGDLHDPDLAGLSLTVSEVRVSPDLRNATAFVMPLGGAEIATVLAALQRAAPYLRSRIGGMLRLRYLPTLTFRADPSFDAVDRIDEILRSPGVVRDLGERPSDREDSEE